MSEPDVVWPEVGSVWVDIKNANRRLTITDVRRKDPLGRQIVGRIGDQDYATDLVVFQLVWRES